MKDHKAALYRANQMYVYPKRFNRDNHNLAACYRELYDKYYNLQEWAKHQVAHSDRDSITMQALLDFLEKTP